MIRKIFLCLVWLSAVVACGGVSYISPTFAPDPGEVKEPAWYVARTLLNQGGKATTALEKTGLPAWKQLRASGALGAVHVLSFVRHYSRDEKETSTKDYNLLVLMRVRDEAAGQQLLKLEREAIKATGGNPDEFYAALGTYRVDLMQATQGALAVRPSATSLALPEVQWDVQAIAVDPNKIKEFHDSVARTDGLARKRLVEQGRVIAFLPLEVKTTLDGPTRNGVRWNALHITVLPKGRGGLRLSSAIENALDEVAPQIGFLRLKLRYRKLREFPRDDRFRELNTLRLGSFY